MNQPIRPTVRFLREPEPIEVPAVKVHRPSENTLVGILEVDESMGSPSLCVRAFCPSCSRDHVYPWPPEHGNEDRISEPAACPGERGRDATHIIGLDPANQERDFGTHRKFLRLAKVQARRHRGDPASKAS